MNFKDDLHRRVKCFKGKLTPLQMCNLYEAIVDYGNGDEPGITDLTVALVFNSFLDDLDTERRKREERAARSRANGAKGGRPPREQQTTIKTEKPKSIGVDFKAFADYFNKLVKSSNSNIPMVEQITPKRQSAIMARVREHGKASLAKVIQNAVASNFLNGGNDRNFYATFDWLFKPTNFQKVLEGNYDNISTDNRTSGNQVVSKPSSAEEHKADDGW